MPVGALDAAHFFRISREQFVLAQPCRYFGQPLIYGLVDDGPFHMIFRGPPGAHHAQTSRPLGRSAEPQWNKEIGFVPQKTENCSMAPNFQEKVEFNEH